MRCVIVIFPLVVGAVMVCHWNFDILAAYIEFIVYSVGLGPPPHNHKWECVSVAFPLCSCWYFVFWFFHWIRFSKQLFTNLNSNDITQSCFLTWIITYVSVGFHTQKIQPHVMPCWLTIIHMGSLMSWKLSLFVGNAPSKKNVPE